MELPAEALGGGGDHRSTVEQMDGLMWMWI